ncbi:MAG: tetratricopeptide repeat protein [Verrucomicrobia bacterium]|nr:tetratricopeptide repeat protein [Verrucomicrobiota bacterium]
MRSAITGGLLLALMAGGCATRSRPPAASDGAASMAPADPQRDFSPKAVSHRTEAQARFATAYLHDLNDRHDEAAEEYLRAGLEDITNEALVLEITGRLLRFKKIDKALQLMKQAAAQEDASGLMHAQLGLVHALSGNTAEAIAANRKAIEVSPGLLAGYRHLAQLHFQEHQSEEGLAVLDQAARQPDTDAEFLAELGEFYLAFSRSGTNNTARAHAKEVLLRAARMNPTHPIVLQKIADGLGFLGETEQSARMYEKLLEQFPQLPGIREKLADLYLRNKDYTQAAAHLRSIIELHPTDPRPYYWLGSLAYEAKDMTNAVDCFRKVVLLNPKFEPAYYDLAGAQLSLDQAAPALQTLANARDRFKPNFVGEFYTGLAHGRLKQYRQAVEHLVAAEVVARATDTNRLNHLFYFQLGAAYERHQQYDEAARSFRQCLALAPDFSEALNYLGYMWADRGENLQEAREMIEKAVRQEPKNAAFLDSLGWVLYRLNRPQDALPHLLKAIACSEEPDATLQDHLGDVFLALQQPEQARQAWQKALTLEPADLKPAILKKLDSLPPARPAADSAAPR